MIKVTRSNPFRLPVLLGAIAIVSLGACAPSGDKAPNLVRFRNTSSQPDEFVVVPAKPLETPTDVAALPVPTPGSSNRADQEPVADAVAALGGNSSALSRSGIPTSDGALLAFTARNGTDPAIRNTLAAEDLDWRQRNRLLPLERLANVNGYFDAYSRFQLDQQAELARLRALGVYVPTAPPAELQPN